jgi:hypothetical protein
MVPAKETNIVPNDIIFILISNPLTNLAGNLSSKLNSNIILSIDPATDTIEYGIIF